MAKWFEIVALHVFSFVKDCIVSMFSLPTCNGSGLVSAKVNPQYVLV